MANKKHVHAEIIKSWADGAQIQVKDGQNWYDIDEGNQIFSKHFEYRIKPAEPERKPYPETLMTSSQLNEYYENTPSVPSYASEHEEALVWVVNRALRHACDNGQIVTRAEFDRAVGDRQKRDMAVGMAVAKHCSGEVRRAIWVDLQTIISQVK